MDITPIYELRDRLRTAMIAGTNLLAEDFRLKRAVEALAPLEKAAPVFAKVGELSRKLIAPDDEGGDGKEGILLDAITLTDAVCCTQGAVGVSGELEPVLAADEDFLQGSAASLAEGKGGRGMILSNVPYSTLKPLQEALTTSGSGHYAFVQECHRNHPELFKDYRVRAAMVQALGASYGELADEVRDWLVEDGADVAPLLMRGFDPKGKKEMVRRVQVIDKWMGAAANDFYIKQLEKAEGELRQNLILALRHSPENIELLEGMRKTEKGNAKKAVYHALACNDNEKVQALFEELYQKKPTDTMNFLYFSQTPWAARLAARGVTEQLAVMLKEKSKKEKDAKEKTGKDKKGKTELDIETRALEAKYVAAMECALFGKNGPEVCEAIFAVAKQTGKFGSTLHKGVLEALCSSLIREPKEDLLALAVRLYEGEDGEMKYFPAAFLAKLIAGDGSDWLDWLEAQLFEKNPMLPFHFLREALDYLEFDEVTKGYFLETGMYLEVDPQYRTYTLPVRFEAGRLMDLLVRCNDYEIDGKLAVLFDFADKELCARLGDYFYKKAAGRLESGLYLGALKRCGYTSCEGLLVHYAQVKPKLSMWDLEYYIREMPGSAEAKFAEANRIPELVKNGKVKVNNWNEDSYKRWLENWLF